MNNQVNPDRPRSSLGRKLALVLAVIIVLLVALYLIVSSSAFLKAVVLPRVAKAVNADITVADISLSPFSQITLDKLTVTPPGAEPILTADQVRVRYSLSSILGGNYVVHEISLVRPVVQIVQDPSGKSNLDALKSGPGQPSSTSSQPSKPIQLSLEKLALTDGTVRMVTKAKDGSSSATELSQLGLTAENVGNSQSGKLNLGTALHVDHRLAQGQAGTNDLLEGKVNGAFEFKLDQKLMPQSVNGNATLNVGKGEGTYGEVNGLGGTLKVDMTPTELRQLALTFDRGGRGLGKVQASGPLDLAKTEGHIQLAIQSIDRQVLNLVGASHGWDFADSQINSTNLIDLAKGGEEIAAKGQLAGRQISIHQQGQATPTLDLDVNYDVTVNRHDQSAIVRALTINGQQQQKRLLEASLLNNTPMTVSWGANSKGFTPSAFQLTLNDLNLQDWQMLAGTNTPSGRVSAKLLLAAGQNGQVITNSLNVALQDLAARVGSNQVSQLQVNLKADGTLQNLKTIDLTQYQLEATQAGQPVVKASGSAHYDLSKPGLTLQAKAELALAGILRAFPYPGMTASNGTVQVNAAVKQNDQKYSATGNLSLGDFTGQYGSYSFRNYQAALDYDVALDKALTQIRSAALTLRQGNNPGGKVSVTGDYDQDKKTAHLNLQLADLNENGLRPFLEPALGNNKLNSIALSGTAACNYDPKADTSLKADLTVTNWVVTTAKAAGPPAKLGAQVQLDGSLRQQLLELRQCVLKLSPTARAVNALQVVGKLDLAKTNATPSQITVSSDSLDLTPYYDMFAGTTTGTNAAAAKPVEPASPTAGTGQNPSAPPAEPAPMNLPIEQLTAEAKFGRLYLREVAITICRPPSRSTMAR